MFRVLIVDDEPTIAWALARMARDEGCEAETAASAEQALALAEQQDFDLVFLDVRLPGLDGLSILSTLLRSGQGPRVVVMTAFGDLDTAVRAYGEGAFDYLVKPFDLEAATALLRRAQRQQKSNSQQTAPAEPAYGQFIGSSPAMQEVFKRVAVVAPTDAAVLITGESGTGKELAALAVHRHSQRRTGPMLSINLAALSPTVVESELFGHCRGAYTGADSTKTGLLLLADQGTIFLDEIGEVSPEIQVKLLRAIEQQEVIPVGGTEPRKTNFRLIAATNRDLREEIRTGRFREDLYFRLAAFAIDMPPLRRRDHDILQLADYFLKTAKTAGRKLWFSEGAKCRLRSYRWPGNVRQLKNVVQSAALFAREGEVAADHLQLLEHEATAIDEPQALTTAVERWVSNRLNSSLNSGSNLYDELLRVVEKPLLEAVLRMTSQNRAAAAEILGIHRATLRKKLS